jgi:hypothetical protein
MGVMEFWRFDGKNWRILQLQNGKYVEGDRSPTFEIVSKSDLYEFLKIAFRDEVAAEMDFRQLLRQRLQALN